MRLPLLLIIVLLDQRRNFTNIGETTTVMLGKQQAIIHHHIEDPAAACRQARRNLVMLLDLGGHTVCLGLVISGGAVGDLDLHVCLHGRNFTPETSPVLTRWPATCRSGVNIL